VHEKAKADDGGDENVYVYGALEGTRCFNRFKKSIYPTL
jgi:hypothetical protein